jgi:cysteine synthase A
MRHDSILDTIGGTPVIRLQRLAPAGINLYVKVEAFNPGGSVKDRMARAVIEDAEQRGTLKPGQTVVEATSGNTGIALAMVCARKGYPLVVTMAENFSVERRRLMRFFGAKVVLTPAADKGSGMLAKAVELATAHGWFLCRQFENEANADVHSRTTAREILDDFADSRLDYWVTGAGTGGTLKGVARVLRQESPHTRIVVCEPDNSPVLASGIPQPGLDGGLSPPSHPMFRPHLMQGWSPDFIPALTGHAMRDGLVDVIQPVDGKRALETAQALAREEGILVGITAGATVAGALELARGAPAGSNILCMLPDTGERYLSTQLFADILEDMNEDELAISRSTPGYRFDVPAPAPAPESPAETGRAPIDREAEEFVARVIADPELPVVMFALEWCEFCMSVRKLFTRLGIEYRSVDLDSAALQAGDRGGKIRAALKARIGLPTIPQIFIDGRHVGGATEIFDAFLSGALQASLQRAGIDFDIDPNLDAASLLPNWLHKRQPV